jgi:integrase
MPAIRERKSADGTTSWQAQVRIQGHEPQTRSFTRKTDAKEWAADTERRLKTGRFRLVDEAQKRDFSELCAKFKEKYLRPSRVKDYGQILTWWEVRLGRLHLINITSETIQRHLGDLLSSSKTARLVVPARKTAAAVTPVHRLFGVFETPAAVGGSAAATKKTSVGTALRYLAVLSRVFGVAVKQLGWMERSPTDGVERPERETVATPKVLSMPNEAKLLEAADASDNRFMQVIVRIALRTGMRLNEVMRLRWNDIEFREGHALVLVRKPKNKRQRFVPLVADAYEAVVRHRVPRGEAYSEALLFPSEKNRQKPVSIRKAWLTCLKRAGVTAFRFHDLRHTAASRLASQNYSLPRIGNVLGHVDTRSTQIYTHFAPDDAIAMLTSAANLALK